MQLGRVLTNVAPLVVAADDRLLQHLERDSWWLQKTLGHVLNPEVTERHHVESNIAIKCIRLIRSHVHRSDLNT